MAIDDLTTWQNKWAELPKVVDNSWKQNIADYIDDRISNLKLDSYTPDSNIAFTFNKSIFLAGLADVDSGLGNGAIVMGTAFQSAIDSSILLLTPPISIGTPSPTTTFSSITTSVFTPTSSLAASNKIAELVNAEKVLDPLLSEFPVKLREATLLLKANISGLDSSTPTPLALSDLNRSVI